MGILERFSDITKANFNDLLDHCEHPEAKIDQYLADLLDTLVEVKQDASGVLAEEARMKKLADDNVADITRFERLARLAVEAGNDNDARVFLMKKQELEAEGAETEALYEAAHTNAERMRQMHDKLVDDIENLKSRREAIRAKLSIAEAQDKLNDYAVTAEGTAHVMGALDRMDATANSALDRAEAAAELAEAPHDEAEALERKYGGAQANAAVEAELAGLKSALGK